MKWYDMEEIHVRTEQNRVEHEYTNRRKWSYGLLISSRIHLLEKIGRNHWFWRVGRSLYGACLTM